MSLRRRRTAWMGIAGLLGCGCAGSAGSKGPAGVPDRSADGATASDATVNDSSASDSTPSDSSAADSSGTDDATLPDASIPEASSTDAPASDATDAGVTVSLSLDNAAVVSTFADRRALGFRFGFVDGVMGAVNRGDAGYVFFGSGRTQLAEAGTCSGDAATPNTQGAYRFGVATDVITDNFGCRALIANAEVAIDGGVTGAFDRDYVGGGPILALTNGTQHALMMTYHAEFHWGPSCAGGAPCFYGTLGMAASLDGGATFTKLGEIVQPAISRPDWIAAHPLGSVSIGAGPMVLGDALGRPVDPVAADSASTYVYVLFDDYDPTNAPPCNVQQCVGVARALLQDVSDAAFGAANAKPATQLFFKYHAGGASSFMLPAASGSVDDALPGGNYTALLAHAFELSALYDRAIQRVILAYKAPPSDDIFFRTSSDLLRWSDTEVADASIHEDGGNRYPSLMGELPNADIGGARPWVFYTNGVTTWPLATFMSRRINVAAGP